MRAHSPEDIDEDVELNQMESDAFLPGEHPQPLKLSSKPVLERWIPPRLRETIDSISRMRFMVILLSTFFLMFGVMHFYNNRPVHVPLASIALSAQLARNLSNTEIPDYVLTYAPFVFLDKSDRFFPSDLQYHLHHTYATLNFSAVNSAPAPLTLNNLHLLNDLAGETNARKIALASKTNLAKTPAYLHGKKPSSKTLKTDKARSCVVIVNDRGQGEVDAFFMYFYTFNQGPTVVGHELGDHLGDWEHSMIRFKDGQPKTIWYSQHAFGVAYEYAAVEKLGVRPVVYSAKGSHANYARPGAHDLAKLEPRIPKNIAYDHTSRGPLWDPTLSAYYYTLTNKTIPVNLTNSTNSSMTLGYDFKPAFNTTPSNYLLFKGIWGDDEYPLSDPRQTDFYHFHKWTAGPTGPFDKNLLRTENGVCIDKTRECIVQSEL